MFADQPVAIIDIGSNSVRLVVYSAATRIPSVIFNEKVLAGLGKVVGETGAIDPEAEARALLGPAVETVIVKHAVGRFAARSVAPTVACRLIREGTTIALGRSHAPFRIETPIRLEVDFALTQMADMAELVPGSTRIGGRTLEFVHQDYREVFRAWRALYNLASVG